MKGSKWKDEYYVEIYQMLKDGKSKEEIAGRLGITTRSLINWIGENKVLMEAVRKAGRGAREKVAGYQSFKDFVMDRLPEEAQAYWDELEAVEKADDKAGRRNVLDRLCEEPERTRQHLFLYALLHCNFVKTNAMRKVGLPKDTLARWMKNPAFNQLVAGIHEYKCDFLESSLMNLVRQGDSAATIFAAKTQLRHRGYNERVDVNVTQTSINKTEVTVADLPADVIRGLLEAKRKKALELEDKPNVEDAEIVD